MKAPYTTNSHYIRYPKTIDKVIDCIIVANKDLFGRIPYVMLQACMQNRQEYKVVLFNQQSLFVAQNARRARPSKAFSKRPHYKLLEFAETVVQDLKVKCPDFLFDGLVRVDIFQNQNGDMVVNELESLEACYYTTDDVDMIFSQKLVKYWEIRMKHYISVVDQIIVLLSKK